MQMNTTSAMGRLFRELVALRELANQGGSLLEAFARRASGDATNQRAGYRLLGEVHDLIMQARDEVKSHPELNQTLFSNALNSVDVLLKNNHTAAPWASLSKELGTGLVALEFCAERLDSLSLEIAADPADIEALQASTDELISSLIDADLPHDLKVLLMRRAEEIRRALQEYRLHGARGVEAAMSASIGTLVLHMDEIKRRSRAKGVVQFLELLPKIDAAMRTAQRLYAIGDAAIRGLLSLGAGPGTPPEAS